MTERKILWVSQHLSGRFDGKSEKDDILADLDPEDEDDQIIEEEIRNAPKLMESPFGLIEVSDELNPLNQYEYWKLNSNFNITEKEFVITNFVDGVIALHVLSRYELLVGFAPLFDVSTVKRDIEQKLIKIDEYPEALFQTQREILLMN